MRQMESTESTDIRWKGLYKTGGVAAIAMLIIMVIQIMIFILWPPPTTVDGFFQLFQKNWLLGLVSVDLLYILNNTLLILIYLALYMALRRTNESAMLIALIFGLVGITTYFASNTCFEMLSLSNQYAAAANDTQRAIFLSAGEGMLNTYRGTAFDVYYVLNGITLLIIAIVMLKSTFFTRTTAIIGILAGILMAIPSTAGLPGLIFSLASLIPWAIFLILIIPKFLQSGRNSSL